MLGSDSSLGGGIRTSGEAELCQKPVDHTLIDDRYGADLRFSDQLR